MVNWKNKEQYDKGETDVESRAQGTFNQETREKRREMKGDRQEK